MKAIMKDILTLFAITLVSGLLLGLVYEATKDAIAQAELKAKLAAYKEICPQAENFIEDEKITAEIEDFNIEFATMGLGNVVVDEVVCAADADGNVIAYLVTATSSDAYDGALQAMTGVTMDGEVLGVTYLSISETPGLGLKAAEDDFKNQYVGKNVESLIVVKDGADAENEIDAISGATKTSKAVTGCVNSAIVFSTKYGVENMIEEVQQ